MRAIALALLVFGVAAVAAVGPLAAQPAPERQAERVQRLDQLFALLKSAKDQDEADAIVGDIWKVWQQSGTPGLDERMQQVIRMMAYGMLPMALEELDLMVSEAPQWAEAWNKRATVLFLMGEMDRSLADCDRVLQLEPRHFGALAGIGMIRTDKGELREALTAFRKALVVNPFLKERFGLIPALEKELGDKPL